MAGRKRREGIMNIAVYQFSVHMAIETFNVFDRVKKKYLPLPAQLAETKLDCT